MSSERGTPRRPRGFTLLETIVAIVVISVGLAGVLSVFNVNVRNSADPVVRKQLMAVAEEMLEEVALRRYSGATKESDAGCGRSTFDDVSDYHLWPTNRKVCNVEGVEIAALSGYTLDVTVTDVTLEGVPAKRIQVVVARGNDQFTLVTWRTEFATPTP
jgi:MSHA pilin protein MshD